MPIPRRLEEAFERSGGMILFRFQRIARIIDLDPEFREPMTPLLVLLVLHGDSN